MNKYLCLKNQTYISDEFSIVPIRFKDKLDIMQWRNEQIYHLRQEEQLTTKLQENYFEVTIKSLYNQQKPNQILFSYLKKDKCIGYGGLVHINWLDKNAEISFIMKTQLEEKEFNFHWATYLKMIERLAFEELVFHKIYVYAYDLRPKLYEVLLTSGYFRDAVLKDHCYFNKRYLDVVIHSKLNLNL